jgi:hypothetical protein
MMAKMAMRYYFKWICRNDPLNLTNKLMQFSWLLTNDGSNFGLKVIRVAQNTTQNQNVAIPSTLIHSVQHFSRG